LPHGPRHLLPRSDLVLVLLGGTGLGRAKTTLRRPRRIRLEDRPDAGGGVSDVDQSVRVVLPAQRFSDALALHAELRLVRTGDQRVLSPQLRCQAAKEFGISDDRVRLAIAKAGLREGKKVGRWEEAIAAAAAAAGIDTVKLQTQAQSAEVAAKAQATTAEFHALQVSQRPTFLIENSIGDRAVFSGVVRAEPLSAAIETLLADEAAYASWKTHFGDPPKS